MPKRVMCIWLPNWPSQRVSVAKSLASPAAESGGGIDREVGPIILYRRDARRGNIVATANQIARQSGVLPHMPLSQCGPLCPAAQLTEHAPQQDLESLLSLAEAMQCFSPMVGLESLDAYAWAGRAMLEPHGLYLDITGIPPLFSGELKFAQTVGQWLSARGYLASIAIANTIGQSWALANYKHRNTISERLRRWEETGCFHPKNISEETTRDEADETIEPWISILPQESDPVSEFQSYPIEALRLDLVTTTKMHRLGIRTLRQLTALPRAALPSRFGDELLRKIDQVCGETPETIQSLHVKSELCISTDFEYPTPNREDLEPELEKQIQALCLELQRLELGAIRMVARVAFEKNAIHWNDTTHQSPLADAKALASVLQIGLYQPCQEPEHLCWLMKSQLDSPAFHLGDSYWAKGITTQVTLASSVRWKQNNLFEAEQSKHRDAVAKLIDHLSVRLGRENVLTPTVYKNPAPEHTYAWQPMTGLRKDGQEQETKRKLRRPPKHDYQQDHSPLGPQPGQVWRRPTKLLSPPTRLTVTEAASNRIPSVVRYPLANTDVCSFQGPERIETGWWYGAMQQRDYYRLQLANGIWVWCFQDLKTKEWFVHGIFD